MIRQFDSFDGSGNAEDASYWDVTAGTSWPKSNGGAALGTMSTLSRLIHQTDAGLGLPRDHTVQIRFRVTVGGNQVGVSMLGSDDPDTDDRVELQWVFGTIQALKITVPGHSPWSFPIPVASDLNPSIAVYHVLTLRAIYQGSVNGAPYWIFRAQLNANAPVQTPAVPVVGWTSSKVHVGIVGKRVPGPVFSFGQSIIFIEEFACDDLRALTHEPAPTAPTVASRTPITPGDEMPYSSPGAFPGKIQLLSVSHPKRDASFPTEAGYTQTWKAQSRARRLFRVAVLMDDNDRDQIQAYFDGIEGAVGNFRITLTGQGIGTVDICLGNPVEELVIVGPGPLWGGELEMVEVFDASDVV